MHAVEPLIKALGDENDDDAADEVESDIPAETGINSTVIPDFVPGYIPNDEKNSTVVTVIAKDNSTTPTPASEPAVK